MMSCDTFCPPTALPQHDRSEPRSDDRHPAAEGPGRREEAVPSRRLPRACKKAPPQPSPSLPPYNTDFKLTAFYSLLPGVRADAPVLGAGARGQDHLQGADRGAERHPAAAGAERAAAAAAARLLKPQQQQ